jgi:predicted AlkP superfamily pyrophosphatase or phosphodiesterase
MAETPDLFTLVDHYIGESFAMGSPLPGLNKMQRAGLSLRFVARILVAAVILGVGATFFQNESAAVVSMLPTTAPAGTLRRIPPARTTVVWVSIDGFRHDYLERFHPPALCRLAAEGASTTHEIPIFPSLTFPNHISQVTGVGVDGHGIPLNNFLDETNGQTYSFPDQSKLLRAEPIWLTASRQGVPTACIDWPMSHNQKGPDKAAYFGAFFDSQETDLHRLDRILTLLNSDADRKMPYRLILGYISHVDTMGHRTGPTSPQIRDAVLEADANVDHFVNGVIKWFNATHTADDELVLIFSTDHGMTDVKNLVNLDRLIGADLVKDTKIVTSGPVATIHCPATQPGRPAQIVDHLRAYPFLTAWKAGDVPAADHFSDPSRIGQVVVMLKPGYSFTGQRMAATLPVPAHSSGMHGFDPAECPDMQGAAVIWRLRQPIGGRDLGRIDNTQWDATVCGMLGIHPPPAADQRAVALP